MIAERVFTRLWKQIQTGGTPSVPEYLSTHQAAILVGLTDRGMEDMRLRNEGPPYTHVGRKVRYRAADLRDWAESRRFVPGGAK